MDKVAILMPAFNEGQRISPVVQAARALSIPNADVEVVVIDDGSSDDTAQVAARAGARVISLPKNRGVGAAMAAGLEWARNANMDYVVHIDSDGQIPPDQIPSLLERGRSGEADLVNGTRFESDTLPSYLGRWKSLALKFTATVVGFLLGVRLTDLSCGFRCLNRRALAVSRPDFHYDYIQQTLLQVLAARLKVINVPIRVISRPGTPGGLSRALFRYAFYYGFLLFWSLLGYVFQRYWPVLRWVLLAVAVGYSTIQRAVLPLRGWDWDTLKIVEIAFSWLRGEGLVISWLSFKDVFTIQFVPLTMWPPTFSLLLASFFPFGAGDMHGPLVAAHAVTALLFYSAWFFVLDQLKEEIGPVVCLGLALFWAFAFDPLHLTTPTQALSVAFFSWAFAVALRVVRLGKESWRLGLLSGVAMGVAVVSHYATWVLLPVIAAGLMVAHRSDGKRGFPRTMGAYVGLAGLIFLLFLAWQYSQQGTISFLAKLPRSQSVMFKNLLTTYPFFATAFGLDQLWVWCMSPWNSFYYCFNEVFLPRGHLLWLPILYLILAYVLHVKDQIKESAGRLERFTTMVGLGVMLITFATLAQLTLASDYGRKTYVGEGRYFVIVAPFIAIAVLSYAVTQFKNRTSPVYRVLSIFVVFFFLSGFSLVVHRAKQAQTKIGVMTKQERAAFGRLLEKKKGDLPLRGVFYNGGWPSTLFVDLVLQDIPLVSVWDGTSFTFLGTSRPVYVVTLRWDKATYHPVDNFIRQQEADILWEGPGRDIVGFRLEPGTYNF